MYPILEEPIKLSEEAAKMAIKVMEDEGLKNHGLRIGITGGGCSGLQYLLDFVENGKEIEDDFKYDQHGVTVLVDPFSASHLRNTVIEYQDTLSTVGFKFVNPNASRTCGCNSSFST